MSQLVDHQIQQQLEMSIRPFLTDPVASGVTLSKPQPLIKPWRPEQLQPASYDLRLGRELRNENGIPYQLDDQIGALFLAPSQFWLGHTEEYIRMPANLCGRVEGKSTIGRQGLAVHVTAGFIDPGFHGQITLELKHQGVLKPFRLVAGMLIAQITFHSLSHTPRRLYGDPVLGSHYQGQLGATPAAK